MTALPGRGARSTRTAFAASIAALAVVGVLGYIGADTLGNSTTGRTAAVATAAATTSELPATATALIGVVDDDGRLTSAAVAVIEPDGTGGTLVALAASADVRCGNSDELEPLNAVLRVDGALAFKEAAERLTALSFDVIEIVDQPRFAQLVTPLGELPTDLPIAVHDSSSGERWEAGQAVLGPQAAAQLVTAHDDTIADWYYEPARAAVWAAVADRAGTGEPPDVGAGPPVTLDEFFARLFAGPVVARPLGFVIPDDERVAMEIAPGLWAAFGPGSIDAVVVHTRSEVLLVFGSIAPARVGAPLDAVSVRIVADFSDADLAGTNRNRADVIRYAIDRLLYTKVNVVAVAELPGSGAPERTTVHITDPALLSGISEFSQLVLGDSDVTVQTVGIAGVDLDIELGRAFLALLPPQ